MLLSLGMVPPSSLVKCILFSKCCFPVGWDPCSTWVCPIQGLGGLHKENWEMLPEVPGSHRDLLPFSLALLLPSQLPHGFLSKLRVFWCVCE